MTCGSLSTHLQSRFLDTTKHRCWLDEEQNCATFALWTFAGNLAGYQRYRPDKDKSLNNDPRGRYCTRKTSSMLSVWGLESWSFSHALYVTEGLFDAARLTWNNMSAIAVVSNNLSKELVNWLWVVQQTRPVVAVCDSDAAGARFKKYFKHHYVVRSAKDLSEASETEVQYLISSGR